MFADKKRLTAAVLLTAMLMTLVGPLQAFAGSEVVCGLQEHAHSGSCYRVEAGKKELTCKLQESPAHQHTASCYSSSLSLTCQLPEQLGHTHDDDCYMTERVLSCFEPEGPGHVHDYFCQDSVLVCWENHEHSMDCYETQIVCGIEEGSGHVHTDACYTTQRTLSCGRREEPAGHIHLQGCYAAQETLTCGSGTNGHTHVSSCYSVSEETSTLICALPEHTHTSSCYEQQKRVSVMTASVSGTSIQAVVPEGAFPDGAKLVAESVGEGDSGYSAVQKALQGSKLNYDGFAVFDIRFELDGEEIEPSQPVQITLDTSSIIPSSADPNSVAVQHLVEPRATLFKLRSAGTSLKQVAAAKDIKFTKGSAGYRMSASFEVDSFSYFTVTWVEKGKILNLHCVDTSGNALTDDTTPINVYEFSSTGDDPGRIGNIILSSLDTKLQSLLGITYPFDYAYIMSGGQKVKVERISYNDETSDDSGNKWPGWIYSDGTYHRWLAADGTPLGSVDTADVYLVFDNGYPFIIDNPINKDIHVTVYDFGSKVNSTSDAVLDFFSSPSGGAKKTFAQIDGDDPAGNTLGGGTRPTMYRTLVDGYPYIASIGTANPNGGSLEYLFHDNAASEYEYPVPYSFSATDGYTTDFVSRRYTMNGDGGLFFRDEETGYYSYNCSENAAFFNGERFELYDALIAPGFLTATNVTATSNTYFWYNFFPFNKPVVNANTSAKVAHPLKPEKNVYFTGYNATTENPEVTNNWFGMKMDFRFMMPQDGQMNGQDMEFYFCGDDDVWVYIDGVLVLDIGGTHGAKDAYINFATGALSSEGTGATNLRAMYESAYQNLVSRGEIDASQVSLTAYLESNGFKGNGLTFSDYSLHRLDFFYMERGGNISYCELSFNIPVLNENSVSITKGLTTVPEGFHTYGDPEYAFQVLHAEEDGTPTEELFMPAGTPYMVYDLEGNLIDASREIDEYGLVRLKQGQVAVIDRIPENSGMYYCREILQPGIAGQYAYVEIDGVFYTFSEDVLLGEEPFVGASSPAADIAAGSANFVFTNQVKLKELGSLSVSKTVNSNSKEDYTRDYSLYVTFDGTPIAAGTTYLKDGVETLVEQDGYVTIRDGEEVVFERLLLGTEVSIYEDFSDIEEYPFTVTYAGDTVTTESDEDGLIKATVSITGSERVSMSITNQRTVLNLELPESGGAGSAVLYGFGFAFAGLAVVETLLRKKKQA